MTHTVEIATLRATCESETQPIFVDALFVYGFHETNFVIYRRCLCQVLHKQILAVLTLLFQSSGSRCLNQHDVTAFMMTVGDAGPF